MQSAGKASQFNVDTDLPRCIVAMYTMYSNIKLGSSSAVGTHVWDLGLGLLVMLPAT